MAVLVEVTSVIIRAAAIAEKIPGGWEAFIEAAPTEHLCSDDELVSVILFEPKKVTDFANALKNLGLDFDWESPSPDVAFADQKRGLLTETDWLEFSQINIGIGGTGPSVAICRLTNSQCHELRLPEGWQYDSSLTKTFGVDAP